MQISNCILIYMERKKRDSYFDRLLGESGRERRTAHVSSDQQRSCERVRLSRSSDIIPVLQVKTQTKRETYICCTVFTRLQCMTKVKC